MSRPTPLLGLLALAAFATPLHGQAPLPLGTTGMGSTAPDTPAEFVVTLDAPGFLTVLVRPAEGTEDDLVLTVTDDEMQTLPDGYSDQDVNGVMSAEQVVARIPLAGTYRVLVEAPYGYSMVGFEIGSSFLATDLAAGVPDPDGRPSGALALEVGSQHADAIDPAAGDAWDWFSVTAGVDGVLTVLTRAIDMEEGDLKIEIFRDGEFREPFDISDQDQGEVLTNESITADVVAGETIYVRVSPAFGGGPRVAYRMSSGLIPG